MCPQKAHTHSRAYLSVCLSVQHTHLLGGGREEGDKLQALVYDILPSAGSDGLEGGTQKKGERENRPLVGLLSDGPVSQAVLRWHFLQVFAIFIRHKVNVPFVCVL